jgi:regulator of cell morphogenesis and NO signaling
MTTPRIDPSLTVNEILLRYPAAVTVINAYGIDSCCGGGIPLEAVAREQQLDLDAITAELERLATAEPR